MASELLKVYYNDGVSITQDPDLGAICEVEFRRPE